MVEAALVVLGWVLGLLSSPITEFLRKRQERVSYRQAAVTEMGTVAYRMAHLVYAIELRHGKWDRAFLEWLKSVLIRYKRAGDPENLLTGVTGLLGFEDDKLQQVIAAKRVEAAGRGWSVKEVRAPFLEAHLSDLRQFDADVQRRVLEVAAQLALFNAHVTDAREWFRMTFDESLGQANREAVESNLACEYRQIGERARVVIEAVEAAEKALSPDA